LQIVPTSPRNIRLRFFHGMAWCLWAGLTFIVEFLLAEENFQFWGGNPKWRKFERKRREKIVFGFAEMKTVSATF
jgi:hypothetical protein